MYWDVPLASLGKERLWKKLELKGEEVSGRLVHHQLIESFILGVRSGAMLILFKFTNRAVDIL